tara:strand:- start:1175 stop:2200 length:1026 start_codon:yes stop_codon:yes gene_type:complete
METLEERSERYRALVTEEMRSVIGECSDNLFGWMRYHLGWEDAAGIQVNASPGKMIRSVGLLLTTEIAGGTIEQSVPAGAAVELVHNFSLLHDDIEDRSDRRRGRPALWTFAGEAQAINVGDGMYTMAHKAMHRLEERDVAPDRIIAAMRELDDACLRLVQGQYADMKFEQQRDVTIDDYLAMACGKTAAMFSAPLAIGATIAGADEAIIQVYRNAGRHIGLAFQMVDDILGIWGDPEVTGKPIQDDLRSRKMTYPVVTILEGGSDAAVNLRRLYTSPSESDAELSEMAALIDANGGRRATETRAREEHDLAIAILKDVGIRGDDLEPMKEYASQAIGRTA